MGSWKTWRNCSPVLSPLVTAPAQTTKETKRHKKKCEQARHIRDTALGNRRCCLFSRVQQAERGEELLQRRAAESQRRELQTGHEVRHSERGEEHGCDAEPRPAARGTDTRTHTRKMLMDS